MEAGIETIRRWARQGARVAAAFLHRSSGGRIHPDQVTIFGLLAHLPIVFLIAGGEYWIWAGMLLAVVGLLDTVDGELARLQNRSSVRGMVLDASTDRFKEVMLYVGVAYFLAGTTEPRLAVWAVIACGASLCVSYVKAKGEAAASSSDSPVSHETLNRMLKDGLLTFELRMAMLVAGLLTGWLTWAVAAIAILASATAVQRLLHVTQVLRSK